MFNALASANNPVLINCVCYKFEKFDRIFNRCGNIEYDDRKLEMTLRQKLYTAQICMGACQAKTWLGKNMAEKDTTVDLDRTPIESSTSGLDLFSSKTPQKARYRFLFHAGIYVALLILVVWPAFPVFNRVEPYILGLPFNMFWNALILAGVLVNSLLLYNFDRNLTPGGR